MAVSCGFRLRTSAHRRATMADVMADVEETMARSKGDGSIYQRKSDGMWCALIELPRATDGRRRRKTIVRKYKQDLVAEMRKVRAELAERGDLPTSSPTQIGRASCRERG